MHLAIRWVPVPSPVRFPLATRLFVGNLKEDRMKKVLFATAVALAACTFPLHADSGPGGDGSDGHYHDWDDDGYKSSGHYYDGSKKPSYNEPKSKPQQQYAKKHRVKNGKHAKYGKPQGHHKGKGHGKHGKDHGNGHRNHNHGSKSGHD